MQVKTHRGLKTILSKDPKNDYAFTINSSKNHKFDFSPNTSKLSINASEVVVVDTHKLKLAKFR